MKQVREVLVSSLDHNTRDCRWLDRCREDIHTEEAVYPPIMRGYYDNAQFQIQSPWLSTKREVSTFQIRSQHRGLQ